MLVRADGSIAGTIGGGSLEASAIRQAGGVLEIKRPRLADFDSAQLGMACGGGGLVLMDYVYSGRPGHGVSSAPLWSFLEAAARDGW